MKIIGIVGWSGSGKTTLLKQLIPELVRRGLTVSTVKHAHHGFDVDAPGKDSHTHRLAGASEVLVSSGKRFALMRELRNEAEWRLPDLLRRLAPVDLVLIEGFKRELHPKIEVFRAANGKPPLFPDDPMIRAIAADTALEAAGRPVIDLNDPRAVAGMALAQAVPLAAYLEGSG